MKHNLLKRLLCLAMATATVAGATIEASACCGLYVGSQQSANGSTYVGRSEDIGKLYDKVFEVRPAADHAEGEMYEDTYGFSMPYPAHTYRYTVMRDSIEHNESVVDDEGNVLVEAYGEVGMNEKGVSVSATVSTSYNKAAKAADPLVSTGICEISLTSVILMTADSARDGVEKLAEIIDTYGSGECNSFTISDANEVWDFETLSGYQYVAMKMPEDKVSVNPNMVVMNEIDVSDTENIIASENLISLPLENGFLVSSQQGQVADEEITKIDIQKTYGSEDFGNGQYFRYWQGVNYLNEELAQTVSVDRVDGAAPEGPFNMLFEADRQLTTYEVLRLLACRGEDSELAADNNPEKNPNGTAIGNERQAECHVFEIRSDMPEALATIQWQTMSRAEFSVYLPYYTNLLTDTSEIFKTEYSPSVRNIEDILDDEDFPAETSAYWVFAAINDLCDNDRERYGANVKAYWEQYQKTLIEQQAAVDEEMERIYAESPALAEEKATALAKAVSEEAFGYAKSILTELRAFIAADEAGELTEEDVFVPTVLTENKMPTYSMDMPGVADPVCSADAAIRSTGKRDEQGNAIFNVNLIDAENVAAAQVTFTAPEGATVQGVNGFTYIDASTDGMAVLCYQLEEGGTFSCDGEQTIATITVPGTTPKVTIDEVLIASYQSESGEPAFGETVDLVAAEAVFAGYDIDGNGKVDLLDVVAAMSYYQVTSADDNWTEAQVADMDGNGKIDINDLVMIVLNYT